MQNRGCLDKAMRDPRIQVQFFDDTRTGDPMQCLWMLAGVVDYKLCDRKYECDQCPFDGAIRAGAHSRAGIEQAAQREPQGQFNVQGYELMPMLFYHPHHMWARIEEAGSVRIGIDDFGQRLTGRVYEVELPTLGAKVGESFACWRVAHHAGETSIASPVSGLVLEVNSRLREHPSLINRDPYGEGWIFVVRPVHLERCLRRLYYGEKVAPWYEREIERLYRAMGDRLASYLPTVGATMQDGGSRIQDFTSLLTADQMRQMIDSFMSAPGSELSAAAGAATTGSDQGR
jgi:glycine cleavage system H lipoate-binding protein